MPCSSRAEHPSQGPGWDVGRGQGRLLEDLRHERACSRPRAEARGDHRRPDQPDSRPLPGRLTLGDEVPDHRPRGPDPLSPLPAEQHNRVRHSDFIKRTFGETRRRVKVISLSPARSATSFWSGCARPCPGASRGLTVTADGVRLLQDLRRSLLDPPRQLRPRILPVLKRNLRPSPHYTRSWTSAQHLVTLRSGLFGASDETCVLAEDRGRGTLNVLVALCGGDQGGP
jgi:hypothetical protein